MRVSKILLCSLPIDNSYKNVLDAPYEGDFYDTFLTRINSLRNKVIIEPPYAPRSIPLNFSINITATFLSENFDDSRINDFNYCVIFPEGDTLFNGYYFINNIVINNSAENISVSFSCERDVWTTHYNEIKNAQPQSCIRCHKQSFYQPDEAENPYVIMADTYSNESDSDLNFSTESYSNSGYDILWERYLLDSEKEWHIKVGDNYYPLIHMNGLETQFFTAYRPVAVYKKYSTERERLAYMGGANSTDTQNFSDFIYIGTQTKFNYNINTTYAINADVTFNVPFDVVKESNYFRATNCRVGYLCYADNGSYTNVGNGLVMVYQSTSIILERTDSIIFDDYKFTMRNIVEQWNNGQYFPYKNLINLLPDKDIPPFKHYMIVSPNNANHMLFKGKILSCQITKMFNNFGTAFRYNISTYVGNYFNDDYNIELNDTNSNVPLSVSSIQQFRETSFNTFNTRYDNQLKSNELARHNAQFNELMSTLGNVGQVGAGVGTFLSGEATGIGSIVSGGVGLVQNATRAINNEYVYDVQSQLIGSAREAEMRDINNRASISFNTSSSGKTDIIKQDRIMLYKREAINDDTYIIKLTNIYKYGNVVKDNLHPLISTRAIFDFYQSAGSSITTIANFVDRAIVEQILNNGVTKWHLNNPYYDVLSKHFDKRIVNKEEYNFG